MAPTDPPPWAVLLPLSYSGLSTYWKCPLAFKLKYIDKVMRKLPPTPEIEEGVKRHEEIEVFLNFGGIAPSWPDPAGFLAKLKAAKARAEVEVAVRADGSPTIYNDTLAILRGKLDVKAPGVVVDWKTGKVRPGDTEKQATCYQAMVGEPVTVFFHYLERGVPPVGGVYKPNPYAFEEVREWVDSVIYTRTWVAKQTPLCAWCAAPPTHCRNAPEVPR